MAVQLSDELKKAIETVVDGWYSDRLIDWEDCLDRIETYSGVDLGCDMMSDQIKAIKAYARRYKRLDA